MDNINHWFAQHPNYLALTILLAFVVGAVLVELLIRRIILRLVKKTKTNLDDEIVQRFRFPLILSIVFVGIHFALPAGLRYWTAHFCGGPLERLGGQNHRLLRKPNRNRSG